MEKKTKQIPLISVVVASYNHKRFIKQTIESICTQNYERIQLIVIDDGSTDGSVQYIMELQKKYQHLIEEFLFISQANVGLAKTINAGIFTYVTGEYMTFVASDDYLLEESLKLRLECINDSCSDVVFSECKRVDEYNAHLGNVSFTKERFVSLVDLSVRSNFLPAPSAFYKTSVLKNIGGFDESLWFEDLDMWFRLLKTDHKIFLLKKNLICYRDVKGSMSKQVDKIYKCSCQIMDKHSDIKGMKHRRAWVFLSYYKAGGFKLKTNHFKAFISAVSLMNPWFLYTRYNSSGR
jgi:alpha-1,3-rhamnosyltransferase